MATFIKLTRVDSRPKVENGSFIRDENGDILSETVSIDPILVNVDKVKDIIPKGDMTEIRYAQIGENNASIYVKEDLDSIINMLTKRV